MIEKGDTRATHTQGGASGWDGYMLGMHFVVCILLSTFLGYLLDDWLGTLPLFMLLGLFLGFAAGLWRLFKAFQGTEEAGSPEKSSDVSS